jgi:two-component system, cell cycle sensor histidine kinase and response regulator CckA
MISGTGRHVATDPDWMDALPAAACVIQDHRFVYVNAALARLIRLPTTELAGQDARDRMHPDDRQLLDELAALTRGSDAHANAQVRIRCGDGKERSVLFWAVGIPLGDSRALLCSVTDVTLQLDAQTLAVRMAALGRLAGGVAHDFNNLLLVVGGHLERLRETVTDSTAHASIEAIAGAADRAAMLTDRLLSFGRRQRLDIQTIDLGAFVEEAAETMRRDDDAGIELHVDQPRRVRAISADPARLAQALQHLVENARESMDAPGRITVCLDEMAVDAELHERCGFLPLGAEFVRLRVIDTGGGMNPAIVPHVFEPFFTTKGRGRGTGMGLASVYGLVKQSGGYALVERTGPEGTCMTLLFPPSRSLAIKAAPATRPIAPPAARRPRVLLVEDDAGVRDLLADLLVAHGYDVHAFETAEEAAGYALAQPVDLLLSDIDLPGMNGATLAASLRARQPGVAILLMSGYPDDGAIAAAGFTEPPPLLSKPYSMTTLLARVRDALGAASST